MLGRLRAETDGHLVTRFSTRQTAALLARLALWPHRSHAREELVELLWPDAEFDAARARLRQALTSLRRQLEPPGVAAGSVLIADRTHVRLNPDAVSTDVAEFEEALRLRQLDRVRTLYKGELLPGFYDDWILAERERLQASFDAIPLDAPSVPQKAEERAESEAGDEASRRLPLYFTRFFGRAEERARLSALLDEHSLITLTGPGGVGKTRLAIEVARGLNDLSRMYFVAFADVREGASLAEAMAQELQLPRNGSDPVLERLVEELQKEPAVLVLDNLEHVVEEAAPLVRTLLERVPQLRVLATSRRRLNVAEERAFPVRPLPHPLETSSPERLARQAAVQIFVDRAQRVRPDFQLTPRNAADISALCRQLEGLPLAIELAAAQVATLTPAQLLERLEKRFELLVTRRSPKDARHRSLWATIAWSVDSLPPKRRELWTTLAVFRGGFGVEAVAAIAGEPTALKALTQLHEGSLVMAQERGGVSRFWMLESLREFAQSRIAPPQWDALRTRHLRWYADWSEETRPKLFGIHQENTLEQVALEEENVQEALRWSLEPGGDAPSGLRLIANLGKYWTLRGNLARVYEVMERLVTHPANQEPSRIRTRALTELAHLARLWKKDFDLAASYYERVVSEAPEGDSGWWERSSAFHMLGSIAWENGDQQKGVRLLEEALALSERHNHTQGVATIQAGLAMFARDSGDYPRARTGLKRVVEIQHELGYLSGIANFQRVLGKVHLRLDERASARECYAESLDSYCALGDTRGLAVLLGELALEIPPSRQALLLLGAAHAFQERIAAAIEVTPDDPRLESHRAALGAAEFAQAWREGAALSVAAAAEEARALLREPSLWGMPDRG